VTSHIGQRLIRCGLCDGERWDGVGPCTNVVDGHECGALTPLGAAYDVGGGLDAQLDAGITAAALDIARSLERMAYLVPVFAAQQGFRVAAQRVCSMHDIDHVIMVARPVRDEHERKIEKGLRSMRVNDVVKGQEWSHFAIRGDYMVCPTCGDEFGRSYDELVSVVRPHIKHHKDQDEL
jgi:hypothetical protein